MKHSLVVMIGCLMIFPGVFSQSSAIYLQSPKDDIALFDGYWAPMRTAMAISAATGLSGSGKILDKGKFRLDASWINVQAPQSATTQPMSNGLVYQQPGGNADVPTILGGESEAIVRIEAFNPVADRLETMREFEAPAGINTNSLSHTRLSAAVGVGYGLEFQGRIITPMDMGEWSARGFGAGVKFEVGKMIPAAASLPLDVAIQVSYNQFRTNWELPYDVAPGTVATLPPNPLPQTSRMVTHQALAQMLISKKIGPIMPFLSAGLSRSESILAVEGDYAFNALLVNEQSGDWILTATSIRNPYYDLIGSFRGHLELGLEAEISLARVRIAYQVGAWQGISAGVGVAL